MNKNAPCIGGVFLIHTRRKSTDSVSAYPPSLYTFRHY
jgi:hypothetical protein